MISKVKHHKENIKNIFQESLELNLTPQLVSEYVTKLYNHSISNKIYVVALGKSGSAMLEGVITALGARFNTALLITKTPTLSKKIINNPDIQVIIAGHPIPNENSLYAGEVLIQYCQALDINDRVLFLISGGSSSLVEYFPHNLPNPISIYDLKRLNNWLLASDRSIKAVNKIRKRISGIKAGKLLNYINCNYIDAVYISDVPNDELTDIGSGLLIQDNVTDKINNIPDWISEYFERLSYLKKSELNINKKITAHILFSNSMLRDSLQTVACAHQYDVFKMDEFIVGNTSIEASRLATWLKKQKSGLYIWGAETHMSLPGKPGRGGRNQSFALVVACELQNFSNIVVLIAATDGNDGNTADAGAIIDSGTIARGEAKGVSVTACLDNANAGEFLSASGDLLTLAATGTNVMDIVMAIIWD